MTSSLDINPKRNSRFSSPSKSALFSDSIDSKEQNLALGKVGGFAVYNFDSKLTLGAQLKKNMQSEKLTGVLGLAYKLCEKTTVKAKINQNLKTSFAVKRKLCDNLTGTFGFQFSKDCCPALKGKATRLPFGFSFDVNI